MFIHRNQICSYIETHQTCSYIDIKYVLASKHTTSKSDTRLIGLCINVYLCAYECVHITDTHSLKYTLSNTFSLSQIQTHTLSNTFCLSLSISHSDALYLYLSLSLSLSLTRYISGDLYHSLSFPLTHTYMHKHTQTASTCPTHVSKLLEFFNR